MAPRKPPAAAAGGFQKASELMRPEPERTGLEAAGNEEANKRGVEEMKRSVKGSAGESVTPLPKKQSTRSGGTDEAVPIGWEQHAMRMIAPHLPQYTTHVRQTW